MTNLDGSVIGSAPYAVDTPSVPTTGSPVGSTTMAPSLRAHDWTAPLAAPATAPAPSPAPVAGYRDTYAWRLLKHCAQLGVVAAAITFVFEAGRTPALSLLYACSSLIFLTVVAVLDRQRFEEAGFVVERPTTQIAGHARTWTVPASWPHASHQHTVEPIAPADLLAPLAYEMASALTAPVDVT